MVRMLGIGLLLAMGAAAGGAEDGPVPFRTQARVELDAEGVPHRVHADQTLPAPVRDAIENHVLQWRFEPARVNGAPRGGATTVVLNACAVPAEQGTLRMAMEYDRHGPGYAGGGITPLPPRYPLDAAKAGKQGAFRVVMEIGTDGRAKVQAVETLSGDAWPFRVRLNEWASTLRYLPEEVDGRPVATRIAMSVDFTLGDNARARPAAPARAPECTAAMGTGGNDEPLHPVVLDSPFKPKETG